MLPAAGLGTRFLPATKAQPKEMLPLVDKPLIQYVVEESVEAGITDIVIVTGRGKSAIEDHFDVSFELERFLEEKAKSRELAIVQKISALVSLAYVRQKEALGLGHAVSVAEPLVGDNPFAVLLGDDLVASDVPCIGQMIEVYDRVKAPVLAVMRVPRDQISSYGVIEAEDPGRRAPPGEAPGREAARRGRTVGPRDHRPLHPRPRDLRPPREHRERRARGDPAHERARVPAPDTPIYGFEFEGARHDCGNKLGFLKATVEYALEREDLGEPFRDYLRSLAL